jgi:hypothetical protein
MRLVGTSVDGDIVVTRPPLRRRAEPLLFGLSHPPDEVQRDDRPPGRSEQMGDEANLGTGTDVSKLRWSPTVTKCRSVIRVSLVRMRKRRRVSSAGERPIGRTPAWDIATAAGTSVRRLPQ